MLYLLSPFIASLFCFYLVSKLSFFNIQGTTRLFIYLLFSCKAIAGLVVAHFSLQLLNGNDGYFYFEAGKTFQLYGLTNPFNYAKLFLGLHPTEIGMDYYNLLNWKNLPAFNDGETMIKINSLLHFISFNNYHTHTIFFSFFSFCGLTGIYKSVTNISNERNKMLLIVLVLFPSLIIFTSGNLKESVLVGTSGIFIYHLFLAAKNKAHLMTAVGFGLALLLIKPHFILLLLPIIVSFLVCRLLFSKKILQLMVYFVTFIAYFAVASGLLKITGNETIPYSIALAQQSSMKNSIFVKANSYTQPPIIASSYQSLVRNIPSAFLHGFSHPRFNMNNKLAVNLSAFENIVIMLFLLLNIGACFISSNNFFKYHMAIAMFSISFYTLIGFTQALEATILRFKAPVLPLLISGVYLFLIQFRKQKVL